MSITIGALTYAVQPPQVFAGATLDLMLVIQNPSTTDSVDFEGGFGDADQVQLQFSSLTSGINFTAKITSQPIPNAFTVLEPESQNGYFTLKPADSSASLLPLQSLTIGFQSVPIDSTPGDGAIDVTQLIGEGPGIQGAVSIKKLSQDPAIIAWMDPPFVGIENWSNLNFTWRGGPNVVIQGYPDGGGSSTSTGSGDPPFSDSVVATIRLKDNQQVYTLTVYTVDGKRVAQTLCTLSHHVPFISAFKSTPPITGPISVNDTLRFNWSTLYAASTTLICSVGSSTPLVPPATGITAPICPGSDALNSAGSPPVTIPDKVKYTFVATGYDRDNFQAVSSVEVKLMPIRVLYFKFLKKAENGALSSVSLGLDPTNWPGQSVSYLLPNNQYQIATVYGPGMAPQKLYLGTDGKDAHPQIQYFNATTTDNTNYLLDWITLNLTSLVLDPGAQTIPNIPKGTLTFAPPQGTREIVLTGTSKSGETVRSVFVIGK